MGRRGDGSLLRRGLRFVINFSRCHIPRVRGPSLRRLRRAARVWQPTHATATDQIAWARNAWHENWRKLKDWRTSTSLSRPGVRCSLEAPAASCSAGCMHRPFPTATAWASSYVEHWEQKTSQHNAHCGMWRALQRQPMCRLFATTTKVAVIQPVQMKTRTTSPDGWHPCTLP